MILNFECISAVKYYTENWNTQINYIHVLAKIPLNKYLKNNHSPYRNVTSPTTNDSNYPNTNQKPISSMYLCCTYLSHVVVVDDRPNSLWSKVWKLRIYTISSPLNQEMTLECVQNMQGKVAASSCSFLGFCNWSAFGFLSLQPANLSWRVGVRFFAFLQAAGRGFVTNVSLRSSLCLSRGFLPVRLYNNWTAGQRCLGNVCSRCTFSCCKCIFFFGWCLKICKREYGNKLA